MTRREIFTTVLAEASGKPNEFVEQIVDDFLHTFGGPHKLDEILPDDKAASLLHDLRQEKAGIRDWLAKGAMSVKSNMGHA